MSIQDYENLLQKPAANDVERPWPPAAELRCLEARIECQGELTSAVDDDLEKLAA